MKQVLRPSPLLLKWLGALAGAAVLLGVLSALGIDYPKQLDTLYWGALLALAGVSVFDGFRLTRQSSPRLQRHLPGSLALSRWNEIRRDIEHDGGAALAVRVMDHLPSGLESENLPQSIEVPRRTKATLGYRIRPIKRGHFTFERCELALCSGLRLWSTRRRLDLPGSTRVYPDFARLYDGQLLAVDNWLSQIGVRQSQRRGLGLEFNQLREFREGDSLRQIDWKATARHRAPIAREYQDESDQHIVFMLDCGRRMRSQDGDLSHFDHALNAMLLLSHVALRQGDAVGLSTFAGEQSRYIAPAKGASHLNTLLNRTYDLESGRRPADYSAAAKQILVRQKRQALVIMITNLRDEDDEELLAAVTQLGRRHRVLVVSLREQVLDGLRHTPVKTLEDALDYCGASNCWAHAIRCSNE